MEVPEAGVRGAATPRLGMNVGLRMDQRQSRLDLGGLGVLSPPGGGFAASQREPYSRWKCLVESSNFKDGELRRGGCGL